ncbi:TrmH family RNA methyltransferase [Paenibacillus turpanensis]|uniref:TrmH family RNA methyltransferase n=1 Tax=Paenibacillus turpanensis TaxID=2689078 RepID=UPI00140813BF|nr:RNA methyltransferase [Paenibacillus turpanensis]
MKEIVSPQNERVKKWSALLTKKGRDQSGLFVAEGVHLVREALVSGAEVESILVRQYTDIPQEIAEEVAAYEEAGGELVSVSDAVLAKCSDTEHPQPVLAIVRKPQEVELGAVLGREDALIVVSDGVQDPGNLGTIIRSADAAGASAVLLGEGTVDAYNPKTVRSAMGSLFHLPVIACRLEEAVDAAKERGVQIVVTELEATKTIYEADFCGPTWIVLGNEARGVSAAMREAATESVIIPMKGRAESLNVAMASTVLLFEAMRQRL